MPGLDDRITALRHAGFNHAAIAAILDLAPDQLAAQVADPATADPAPPGGGGSGWQVVSAIAPANHGQPADTTVLFTPEIAVVAAGPTLVEVRAYAEIEENGGFWTIGLLDGGVQVKDTTGAPVGAAVSLAGWGSWSLNSVGAQMGGAVLGADALAQAVSAVTQSGLVLLPDGAHQLSIGVDGAVNAGVGGAVGTPDLNVRNVILAVSVCA